MQLQRGCMPRPLAVWKRLTSRLEKAAASEIELKLALDTARSEVKEVCKERDGAVIWSQAMVMERKTLLGRLDRYQAASSRP